MNIEQALSIAFHQAGAGLPPEGDALKGELVVFIARLALEAAAARDGLTTDDLDCTEVILRYDPFYNNIEVTAVTENGDGGAVLAPLTTAAVVAWDAAEGAARALGFGGGVRLHALEPHRAHDHTIAWAYGGEALYVEGARERVEAVRAAYQAACAAADEWTDSRAPV